MMRALKNLSCSKFILLILVASLGACSSGVKLDEVTTPPVSNTAPTATPAPAQPIAVEPDRSVKSVTLDPLNDPNNPLAKRSVYFEYDSYVIAPEYKSVIDRHAAYLMQNTDRKVLIQGNTDERGTTEYNLALGQKRAEEVRRALSVLGVKEAQIEAVSLGKEKPRNLGHDEAAWQENRRVDLAY